MPKNRMFKLCILTLIAFFSINMHTFAQNSPLPVSEAVQAESVGVASSDKVRLKAPINEELTEEERLKAEEEAKIREEIAQEQKQIGEAVPLKVEDKDFDPNTNDELTKNVVPNTGTELMKFVSMFARVMLGVIIASLLLYFILLFTKKYFHPPLPAKGEEDFDVRDLNSPKNTDEALKSFLDRTGG